MEAKTALGGHYCERFHSLQRLSSSTPAVDDITLSINTIVQGAGIGFTFVPLNVVAFATLPVRLRYEGTALISLLRNIGSAVGISIFEALQVNGTTVEHSVLAPFASPLNRVLESAPQIAQQLSPTTAHGVALLEKMVTYQARGDRLQQRLLADGNAGTAHPAAAAAHAPTAAGGRRRWPRGDGLIVVAFLAMAVRRAG